MSLSSNRKHLILDLDGTLVGITKPHKHRPHLDTFLYECFKIFTTVSIWSAAPEIHIKAIIDTINTQDRQWLFVYTGKQCHMSYPMGFDETRSGLLVEKRLKKIWNHKEYRDLGINKYNTLIVDDIPLLCRKNYGNAIYISTYYGDEEEDDKLLHLVTYLKSLINVDNVRTINKLEWVNYIPRVSS